MAQPGIWGISLISLITQKTPPTLFLPHISLRGKNQNMEKGPTDILPKGD